MKLLVHGTFCLLIFILSFPPAHADVAARIVKYSQTDIIPIRAKIRFSTLIVLPANEEILDFTTGDKDFWIINGNHNLCYLHPAQAGIRSDLNLVTASGHVYSFLLTEISKDSEADPDLKIFVTPSDQSTLAGSLSSAQYVRSSELEAYKEEVTELRREVAQDLQRRQEEASKRMDEFRRTYPSMTIKSKKKRNWHRSWFPPSTTTRPSPTSSPPLTRRPRFMKSKTRNQTSLTSILKTGRTWCPRSSTAAIWLLVRNA